MRLYAARGRLAGLRTRSVDRSPLAAAVHGVLETLEERRLFATFDLTTLSPDPLVNGAALIAALTTANANGQADTIVLGKGTYALNAVDNTTGGANGLPAITEGKPLTIVGNGATILRAAGSPDFRMAYAGPGADVTIRDVLVKNFRQVGEGGAISLLGARAVITGSTFAENTATTGSAPTTARGLGGAIYSRSSSLTVANCTFTANSALAAPGPVGSEPGGLGGAIFVRNRGITLLNSTLSGNTALSNGGALCVTRDYRDALDAADITNPVNLVNCILANNESAADLARIDGVVAPSVEEVSAVQWYASNNVIGSQSNVPPLPNTVTADPQLLPLADNGGPTPTMLTQPGSPACDGGTAANASETQTVIIYRDFGTDTFTLSILGVTTAVLPDTAPAQQVQNALNTALAPLGGTVSVSLALDNPSVYGITFGGALANTDLPRLTVGVAALSEVRVARNGYTLPATDQRGLPRAVDAIDIGAVEDQKQSLVVTTNADEDDGTSNPAFGTGTSLREALAYANAHPGADTITFDPSLAGQTITLSAVGDTGAFGAYSLRATDTLTIEGPAAGVSLKGGAFELGALRAAGVNLTLKNLTFSSFTGFRIQGAVRFSGGGTLTVERCTFADNKSTDGPGAGIVSTEATLVVRDSLFTRNENSFRDPGGAAILATGSARIDRCSFTDNKVNYELAAVVRASNAVVSNSLIAGNNAPAVFLLNSVVYNSTIADNTLTTAYSAVGFAFSTRFANCTITGNRSPGNDVAYALSGNNWSIGNSILADNRSTNGSVIQVQGATSLGHNIIDADATPGMTWAASDKVGTPANPIDVKLGSLGDNGGPTFTRALLPNSPAINAGSISLAVDENGAPLAYDQRGTGFARVLGGAVDAGAYERENTLPGAVVFVNPVTKLDENTPTDAPIKVADIELDDDGLGNNVLSLGLPDAQFFELQGNALYLKAGTALNYEVQNFYVVCVFVTDTTVSNVPANSANLGLEILDVNEPPTAVALQNAVTSLPENTATTPAVKLADLVVTDDALGTNSFTLSGPDAAFFEVQGAALYLKAGTALNFAAKPSYAVTVGVLDAALGSTPTAKVDYVLSVTSVNQQPTDLALSNNTVPENQPIGTAVGVFSTVDPNTNDTFGYTLVSGAGDADNALFSIIGGTLRTAGVFDFETRGTYSIRVRSTDAGGLSVEKAFTLRVTDQFETARVRNAYVIEGDSGTRKMTFVITLSGPSTKPTVINFATRDGTATAGKDYVARKGTIVIPAGETTATVDVLVTGDTRAEKNETFTLRLSTPGGSPYSVAGGVGTGTGTIVDDDGSSPRVTVGPDPYAPGLTALFIRGSAGSDAIAVKPLQGGLAPTINGYDYGIFNVAGHIIVTAGNGNDDVFVDPAVTNGAVVDAGRGNDTVRGGAGNDLLAGGFGNDRLFGNAGRDILVGGNDADQLDGGIDEDLLIAGDALFLNSVPSVRAVLNAWARTDQTYDQRVAALSTGPNGLPRLWAGTVISAPVPADVLTGGEGRDWFFANPRLINGVGDRITDLAGDEFVTAVN